MNKIIIGAGLAVAALTVPTGSPAGAGEPNCVEFFAVHFDSTIANHGQHIVGDYIMGTGHDGVWPPSGLVGEAVGGNGPAVRGAPGIMNHGTQPGASFCNGSSSPSSPVGH